VPFEITTRWDDTLLDVSQAEDSFSLCDVVLVAYGELVAPASGRVGLVDYEIRTVTPPTRELPLARTDDRRVVPYLAAALAVHLVVWAAATSDPDALPPARAAKPRLRATPIVHASDDQRAELPDAVTDDRAHDTKGNGRAAAARGTAGLAGATIAPRDAGHIAVANTGEDAQLSKSAAVEQARRAGILGDTKVMQEQFRSLGGADQITSGFDDRQNVTASFDGGDGTSRGFGTGRNGEGAGGGGTDTLGTIGRGSYSNGTTLGHAWGGSTEAPPAHWATTWSGHYDGGYYPHRIASVSTPYVSICGGAYSQRCRVAGDLDPAIIRRYVKRNIQKLAYCYEKQLLAKPDLRGPVLVEFAITNGRVEGSTATGVDPTVASCVSDVISNIEFPSAGMTRVEYVLDFHAAGQDPVSKRNATPSPSTQPPSPK